MRQGSAGKNKKKLGTMLLCLSNNVCRENQEMGVYDTRFGIFEEEK